MSGIVERLRTTPTDRTWDSVGRPYDYPKNLPQEAADEIERLRAALEPFAAVAEHDIGDDETDRDFFVPMYANHRAPLLTVGDLREARAALKGEA